MADMIITTILNQTPLKEPHSSPRIPFKGSLAGSGRAVPVPLNVNCPFPPWVHILAWNRSVVLDLLLALQQARLEMTIM